jgi:uncharacterized protein DUF5658
MNARLLPRFGDLRPLATACALSLAIAAPVAAQSQGPPLDARLALVDVATPEPVPLPPPPPRPKRPSALVPLYVSFASLEALDIHSTTRALDRGATEANPVMKGISGNTWALTAVKAAGAAGVIYAGEKMWKKNKTAAVIFMVAANAGMAWVVHHNYRVAR